MFRPHLLLLVATFVAPAWTAAAQLRSKRGASDTRIDQWSNKQAIPYVISSDFSEAEQKTINDVLKKFSNDICLDFELNGTGGGNKLSYVLTTTGNCNGVLVMFNQSWNAQDSVISLRKECVERQGIMHETMHSLGFRHTQCRHDRDEHLKVEARLETKDGKVNTNFKKLEADQTNDYGTPYEYNALLHYSLQDGMDIIDEDYRMSVHGAYLTFNELKMINLRYNCSEKCSSKLVCQNGGYQHPRKCNECVCPQFHQGTLCNEEKKVVNLQMGVPVTQGKSFLKNDAVYNQYGLRGMPDMFSDFQKSDLTLIKAPVGTRILVNITNIDDKIEFDFRTGCNDQGVEIVDGDLTRVGKRFCDKTHIGRSFTSITNVVGFLVYSKPGNGFGATVTFTAVGTPTGTTTTPTKAPVVTTTTTTTKAPVVTTTTAPLPITTTTTKVPPVITTTTPSTSTGGAWCDA